MASDPDRGRRFGVRAIRISQKWRMFRSAGKCNGAFDRRSAIAAATARYGAGNRKEALSIRQFEPLRHNPPGSFKGRMDIPQRASPAVPGEREARAVQSLGDIACLIHAQEEEGHAFFTRALQRCQAMRDLFETCAEFARQNFDIMPPLRAARRNGRYGMINAAAQ